MSEEDDTLLDSEPTPRAEDRRWLRETIGEPRVSKAVKQPFIPAGLDGGRSMGRPAVGSGADEVSELIEEDEQDSETVAQVETMKASDSAASTMVVIDLDVSVGVDDPETLAGISITFSGLPRGASLTAGQEHEDGTWAVPATDLDNLSIVITEDTSDFEITITMDSGDDEPQTATMHVANNPFSDFDGETFSVRLMPGPAQSPVRLFVYLDGEIAFDRVLTWPNGNDTPTNIKVPLLGDTLPFEILMRYDILGEAEDDSPSLVSLDLEDTHISSGSPAITVQGQLNDQGISWQGDLIIDVQGALKSATTLKTDTETPPETSPGADNQSELLSAIEPSDPVDKQNLDPEIDAIDETSTSDIDHEEIDAEPISDVLIVDASLDDLQSQAFVDELRGLRDFIRGKSTNSEREVYERLGVDVSKWRDMSVRGPLGADVDLDPALPSLAPNGGRDNTRTPQKLQLSQVSIARDLQVRVNGVLPGSILTHGKNTGNGIWHLSVSDAEQVSLLPAIVQRKSATLQVSWHAGSGANEKKVAHRSILSSPVLPPMQYGNTDVRMMSTLLDADIYDPDGHGALSITVGDMPPGSTLAQGKNHGGGVWTLETTSGAEFQLAVCASTSPFTITLTCVALDSATGDSTVSSHVLKVNPRKGVLTPRRSAAA